jgi:hypothetical protein
MNQTCMDRQYKDTYMHSALCGCQRQTEVQNEQSEYINVKHQTDRQVETLPILMLWL